jgi:hypothetical protein
VVSAQASPVVTYGACGHVTSVTGINDNLTNCANDHVAGTIVKVESSDGDLDISIRLPSGLTSVSMDPAGINPEDRKAVLSSILSQGSKVRINVSVCGSGGILCAKAIHKLAGRSPGFPSQRRIPSGGRTIADLRRFVGKYQNDAALRNTALRQALTTLGLTDFRMLEHYTAVSGGVGLEGDDIVIEGCAPHECMDKAAAVIVGLSSRAVHAAVLENGIITIYSNQRVYSRLPASLKVWMEELAQKALEFGGSKISTRFHSPGQGPHGSAKF